MVHQNYGQDIQMEIGLAIGKVNGKGHNLGKGEIHFNILKTYKFGQIGLDFSNGGNFIPGTRAIEEDNIETLSSSDSKFGAIAILFRLKIKKHFFIEPRFGYASLYSFVNTVDRNSISQDNITAGLGVGSKINRFTISLRYQYFGTTDNYEGFRNSTLIKSNSETLEIIFLRMSYSFGLDKLFKSKG